MSDPASLQNMQDIIEPAAAGFWPPATGVWLIGVLVMVWVVAAIVLLRIRRSQNAYRRAGIQALRNIRLGLDTPDGKSAAIQELAVLLKRVAMTAYDRDTVAALSGERWLAFLDDTMAGGAFSSAAGHLLTKITYAPSDLLLDEEALDQGGLEEGLDRQIDELFTLAGRWIEQHSSTMPVERSA